MTQIAREFTVRILSEHGASSGVIIQRRGTLYRVLTCDHVLDLGSTADYQVLTYHDHLYPAEKKVLPRSGDLDVGLLEFESQKRYRIASLAVPPPEGAPVWAAGFPNWQLMGSQVIEDTRDWGTRAFRLTEGQIAMHPNLPFPQGYQLGYTNSIEQGMSGGVPAISPWPWIPIT